MASDQESILVPYSVNRTVVKQLDLVDATGYARKTKSLCKFCIILYVNIEPLPLNP